MNDFVTGCTHFAHYGVCLHANRVPWLYENPDYDESKPFDFKTNNPKKVNLEEHDEELMDNWNSVVGRKDRIFVLGDFAFKNHMKYVLKLKGRKIFIRGNHDDMNRKTLNCFAEVFDMGCRKKVQKQDVTFSHYGMRTWASSVHGSWMLYSHSHGRLPEFDNMYSFDCGVDVWGYAPVPWEAVVAKMKIIDDKINAAGGRYVDGEFSAKAEYAKHPEQRKVDTRAKNKKVMESIGVTINEVMWPTE